MEPDTKTIYDSMWAKLEAGSSDRRSPFHTPVIATTDSSGEPQVRTVVLRRVDREERIICCHTDRRAAKVAEIMACDRVSWLFYEASSGIQVRASGTCRIHCGEDDPIAVETWRSVHPDSRVCYAAPIAPSSELEQWVSNQSSDARKISQTPPGDLDCPPDTFVVLATGIDRIEWLDLHHDGHHRVRYTFDEAGEPVATWLAP